MYRLKREEELTIQKLSEFISQHQLEMNDRLLKMKNAYETRYHIFDEPKKPDWKPDNRIAVNFAKHLVDTENGFFMGIPVKYTCDDEAVSDYIRLINSYNNIDDINAELSKNVDVFGRAYEMYYVDESGNIGIAQTSPMDSFMIYDDSVLERKRAFVRLYKDEDGKVTGSLSDDAVVRYFSLSPLKFYEEEKPHGFNGVPANEYRMNEERIGLFEPVITMIDSYNKAISEKANDVDYFADAYMKVLGAQLDESTLEKLRQNRIINFKGMNTDKLVVEFLQKPDGDTSQEHFIDRMERLIYEISGIPNISDDSFGTSSGIAIKYRMTPMSNLCKTKERKFMACFSERYRLIFSNPVNSMSKDAWVDIAYHFTQNYPANLVEEAQIAGQLAGVTSKETQLKVLSIVDDVKAEIDRIDDDNDITIDYPTERNGIQQEMAGTTE